jgi:hypothetical protein
MSKVLVLLRKNCLFIYQLKDKQQDCDMFIEFIISGNIYWFVFISPLDNKQSTSHFKSTLFLNIFALKNFK